MTEKSALVTTLPWGCFSIQARKQEPAEFLRALSVAALYIVLCLTCTPLSSFAEEDTAPATAGEQESWIRSFSTGTSFFDEAALSGGLYYFQRDRRRYDINAEKYKTNLNHATLQANVDFASGFMADLIGVDFAIFGSVDAHNSGSPDHEMNFFPWGNPWKPDWNKKDAQDGYSIYKANVKLKSGSAWARAGYFQPSGPGVLGVNWSIMPGTYQGVNWGFEFGKLDLAFAWADAYKSPWFKEMNGFRKNDGDTRVPWLWSSGVRYSFDSGLMLETAYGESKGHMKNADFKSRYEFSFHADGSRALSVGYQLYTMRDNSDDNNSPADSFAGLASHHFAFVHFTDGPWLYKLEGTYTRAPFDNEYQLGYFAYRLTGKNGSSKGAYDIWWDARSDWNQHNEKAAFVSVQRTLDDLLPWPGFMVGAGAAIGWDGEAYHTAEHLKEWAFNFDLGYTQPDGMLKGAFIKLHYTDYRNGTHKPSWEPYKNAFQSERDVKLFMGIPFDL